MDNLIATEYQFYDDFNAVGDLHRIVMSPKFVRMVSPFYKGEKWAIRRNSECLNRQGRWEYEPLASSRTKAFYKRCRFETLDEAVALYKKSIGQK